MPLVLWPVSQSIGFPWCSASFMQEIELFLSRPGDGRRMARIGMTTVCTAFAMVSVQPWLHWLVVPPPCGW